MPKPPSKSRSNAGALAAFAVAAPGLETIVAAELRSLGVSQIREEVGGVRFRADEAGLARVQISIRSASRVLVRMSQFAAADFGALERGARRISWEQMLAPGSRAELRVSCRKSALYHSGAVAQRVAAELERAVPGAGVERAASEDDENPQPAQLFVVRLDHDRCTISADASGALLHRRGYRLAVARAPMRETLAAALLLAAKYDSSLGLADPLCGAGTIAIEGAMIARRIAPGLQRSFAAESWPGARPELWERARDVARGRVLPSAPAPIAASDRDAGAIESAMANAKRAGVENDIEFSVAAISQWRPPSERGLLAINPPYGVRVGENAPLRDLFARLGQIAREVAPGWRVAMLSADRTLERQTGLEFAELLRTRNGGIPVRFLLSDER